MSSVQDAGPHRVARVAGRARCRGPVSGMCSRSPLKVRRSADPMEMVEPDAADEEVTLDASGETGLRKVQVSAWLLFEDSTSSLAAKVVQGVAHRMSLRGHQRAARRQRGPRHLVLPADVCGGHLEPGADQAVRGGGGGAHRCLHANLIPHPTLASLSPQACIAAFTLEFIARMLAAPATVGLRSFWCNPMNWIDLLAIMPVRMLKVTYRLLAALSTAPLPPQAGPTVTPHWQHAVPPPPVRNAHPHPHPSPIPNPHQALLPRAYHAWHRQRRGRRRPRPLRRAKGDTPHARRARPQGLQVDAGPGRASADPCQVGRASHDAREYGKGTMLTSSRVRGGDVGDAAARHTQLPHPGDVT
eukprot:scaffold25420_cov58-Phaeocystis_antarctica.AAC.1